MKFWKIVVYILLAISVYYTVNNFQEVSTNVYRAVNSVVPKVLNLISVVLSRIRDYCSHDLAKDANKLLAVVSRMCNSTIQVLTPIGKTLVNNVVFAVVSVHENAMSYTEDGLNQILGVEDSLTQQVPVSRHKLLSLILLVFWMFFGIVTFSRVPYNKFFLIMSSTFLLHSIFGPVWCIQQLAFVIGLCMWISSLIANKPIPAAITVFVLFLMTVLRKWKKRLTTTKNAEELVKFNKTMEQRMEGIERKLDILLAKVEPFIERNSDRNSCA